MQWSESVIKEWQGKICPDLINCISNHKNFIPKYLENLLIGLAQTSRILGQILEKQAIVEKKSGREIRLQIEWITTSFRRLRCQHNTTHDKFSPFFDKAVVVIFPYQLSMATWLMLKLGRYWPEKSNRDTLNTI